MNNQNIAAAAVTLHNEARALGQAGNYDLSIEKLKQAIEIQPNWAYPAYDLAYTYLLKGDFENALEFYTKTNEIEPKGFFTAKTAQYTLQGEKSGEFPQGLYLAYIQIEWTDDKNEKFEIAKALTEKVPNYAPAWKELFYLLEDESEKLSAIEQGLSKNPEADTKGILEINKAAIISNNGKTYEARELLENIISDSSSTTANIELAKLVLNSIT
jgi:tetratricopeptide (TPR) repeat protein